MDDRSALLILAVLFASLAGSVACAGPAAGSVSFSEGDSQVTKDDDSSSSSSSNSSSTSAPSSKSDPVFGTSAFAAGTAQNGPAKGKPNHSALPAPANATLDPSGLNCMQAGCHIDTFAFGGTVYTDTAGGGRVAGVEVRVTGPDGKTYASGFSDADGNFWAESVGLPIPANSRVGIRNGTKTVTMSTPISGADGAKCNNATCHGSSTFRVALQ